MLKALIFDWHGVLDLTTFESIAEMLVTASGQPISEVKKVLSQIKEPVAKGLEDSSFMWEKVTENLFLTDEELVPIKNYSLTIVLNKALYDQLKKFGEKYTLILLSDCPSDKASQIRDTIDLSMFKKIIFSCEAHLTKSDDAFFMSTLDLMKILSSEALYIDDSVKHIEKANNLGFNTYHFDNYLNFIQYLERFK